MPKPLHSMTTRRTLSATPSAVVLDALRRITRELRLSSRAAEQELGVSGAQLFVLQQLASEGAESLNELADRTRTDQSSVSVVVSRLVERGLVTREASATDGRRVTIELTPAGQRLLRRSPEPMQARLLEAIEALSPRELETLGRVLSKLAGALELDHEMDEPLSARGEGRERTAAGRRG